jgi:hypothetical protein
LANLISSRRICYRHPRVDDGHHIHPCGDDVRDIDPGEGDDGRASHPRDDDEGTDGRLIHPRDDDGRKLLIHPTPLLLIHTA